MIHRTRKVGPLTTRRGVEELITANYPDQVDYWLGNNDTAKHTLITLRIECPECGYKNVETISERRYLSNLLDLKCFRCQKREQHGDLHLSIPMPFGKHFGKTINDVMEEDPSYLVWFAANIKNLPDLVEQIKSHSRFPNAWADYMNKEAAMERRRGVRE